MELGTSTDPSPPGLLGNRGPRSLRCLQNIWPALGCRPPLPRDQALAFEDRELIKELAATGRDMECLVPPGSPVSTGVEDVGSGTRLGLNTDMSLTTWWKLAQVLICLSGPQFPHL